MARDLRLGHLASPAIIGVVVPAAIVASDAGSLADLPLQPVGYVLLVILALTLVLVAIHGRLRPQGKRAFRHVLDFAAGWAGLAGLFVPVADVSGMAEIAEAPVEAANLALVLAGAFVYVWLASRSEVARSFLVVVLALNIVWSIAIQATPRDQNTLAAELSAQQNVIVLSLDGIGRAAALRLIESDPYHAETFTGFTLFARSASTSPATSMSILAELVGNRPWTDLGASDEELWRALERELITNRLAADGVNVTTYGVYSRRDEGQRVLPVAQLRTTKVLDLLNLSLARIVTPRFTLGTNEGGLVSRLLTEKDRSSASSRRSQLASQIDSSSVPAWSRDLAMSRADFEEYVSNLSVGESPIAAHFLHFTHTHYPVMFDASCEFAAVNVDWYRKNQNAEGVYRLTECALRNARSFLDRLHQLGVLENALVVIKSDHGKPVGYGETGSMEAARINDNDMWGVGRYAPFLAIKPPNTNHKEVLVDTRPVLIDDLAATICGAILLPGDCDGYAGPSLIDPSAEVDPDSRVHVMIVRSPESDFRFETHCMITVSRAADVVESLWSQTRGGTSACDSAPQ